MWSAPLADRVVEVIADLGASVSPRYRYGSGCLVAGRTVVTAAHVVAGAGSVRVRDPRKFVWEARLDPAFVGDVEGPGPDLALIELVDTADTGGIFTVVDMPAMALAAVDRDSPTGDPVERCHVVGYPEFMERRPPAGGRAARNGTSGRPRTGAVRTGRRPAVGAGEQRAGVHAVRVVDALTLVGHVRRASDL